MWVILALLGALTYLVYYILLKPSPQYWKKYGITQVSDIGSVADHFKILLGRDGMTLADLDERAYHQVPDTEKVYGIFENAEYGTPVLLIKDLEMVKAVLVKDFEYFMDRTGLPEPSAESFINKALFNLKGDDWKGVRISVTPTFTTGKIRRMFTTVNKMCHEWVTHLNEEIQRNGGKSLIFNVQKESVNYTVDAIAATIFGLEAGASRNPNSEIAWHSKNIIDDSLGNVPKLSFVTLFPKIASLLKLNLFPKKSINFILDGVNQGMKARMDGTVKANDLLQILAEARKGQLETDGSDELSEFEKEAKFEYKAKKNALESDEMVNAQLIQFFLAGYSTTSSSVGFSLFAFALYPEVQDKLRKEVDEKLFCNGKNTDIDYDELNKLAYLDMVQSEVLRIYGFLHRNDRICTKDYYNKEFKIRIPKGTMVGIPVKAIHNDPKYYERPHEFYPEHFTAERKAERSPYAYLPFGHGPRNCIGMRLALVKSKAAIAHIVHNFKLEPAPTTPKKLTSKGARVGVVLPEDLELKLVPIQK